MQQFVARCMRGPCCSRALNRQQGSSSKSSSSCSSSSYTVKPFSHSLHAAPIRRLLSCCAATAGGDAARGMAGAPDLSALNRLDLSSAMLLANLMQPPGQQQFRPGSGGNPLPGAGDEGASAAPDAPVTVSDFVQALECVVRSSSSEVNPEQLSDILDGVLTRNLLADFTPQQLAVTFKNLAAICSAMPEEVVAALAAQASAHMAALNLQQLANIGWGLMRLAPVADAEERQACGLTDSWIHGYSMACEQQLELIMLHPQRQQQQLPTGQQLANLLLVPAAVQQPFSRQGMQLFEQAVVLAERRLCSMAVAQLLTCYVRLQLRPGQALLELLLRHAEEELQLYDHDMITQVAAGACALQLQLPNPLLADMTERAAMLQASQQADPYDIELLQAAMDRLARAAVAATPV
ncbi:hypothetical protein COO60DRAFT_1075377 [Scenedesmus sp. NREL 46B-D3]|nr:hypothetical protein COO60DRAFT_1075377 [Scenedesmus sp. NREL 46B-D3]